jgi:hypothetical protein
VLSVWLTIASLHSKNSRSSVVALTDQSWRVQGDVLSTYSSILSTTWRPKLLESGTRATVDDISGSQSPFEATRLPFFVLRGEASLLRPRASQ